MYVTLIQTRLKSTLDEDTKKRELIPSKAWQTLDEFEEGIFDVDIEHLFNHHVSVAAAQMNISEKECIQYFRLKEIIREEEEE